MFVCEEVDGRQASLLSFSSLPKREAKGSKASAFSGRTEGRWRQKPQIIQMLEGGLESQPTTVRFEWEGTAAGITPVGLSVKGPHRSVPTFSWTTGPHTGVPLHELILRPNVDALNLLRLVFTSRPRYVRCSGWSLVPPLGSCVCQSTRAGEGKCVSRPSRLSIPLLRDAVCIWWHVHVGC